MTELSKALSTKIDWVLAQRGDPKSGVGAAVWADCLAAADRDILLRAALACVRELMLPEWEERKNDRRPQETLAAIDAWLVSRSVDAAATVKASAKACTASRNDAFGDDHHVPEAARHVAWAVAAPEPALFDALAAIEAGLLARLTLSGDYHRGPDQRRAIAAVLKRVLLPPEPVAEVDPMSMSSAEPVPYSADEHFSLGQRIIHKKFGEVVVTSVGETWIEVELGDASKKRLAHRP